MTPVPVVTPVMTPVPVMMTSDDDDGDSQSSDEDVASHASLMRSINPDRVSFQQPEPMEESSIIEEERLEVSVHYEGVRTYQIVPASSQRQKDKLIDSDGYTYNVKSKRGATTYWQCTVRNKHTNCKASVTERGGTYKEGLHQHIHLGKPGTTTVHKVRAMVKRKAADDHFKSAAVIAEEVLHAELNDEPVPTLPSIENLAQAANRHRKKMRPAEPRDLNFNLDENYIPEGFFRGDVKVDNNRHMIFATDRQMQLLHLAKTWFVDATFNVVKSPFTQLFSIHAFIKADGKLKQVPLMFVLMSGKRKCDYRKVMKKVKYLLPPRPAVTRVVADFEAAMWKGILSMFPDVSIQGCLFHWAQALRRKMGELGILKSYKNNSNVNGFCRKLLALPFLPHEQIPPTFYELKGLVTDHILTRFMEYIERQWITSSFYRPERWSIFSREVRTNNDLEGWHRRLNNNARRGQIQFYLLVGLLCKEGSFVNIQSRLVSEGKLKRHQRKKYRGLQSKLRKLWKRYSRQRITVSQLLSACSHLTNHL